ncbi:MAG: hypothetical protein WCO96_06250 [Actinomycetes bacterium]
MRKTPAYRLAPLGSLGRRTQQRLLGTAGRRLDAPGQRGGGTPAAHSGGGIPHAHPKSPRRRRRRRLKR